RNGKPKRASPCRAEGNRCPPWAKRCSLVLYRCYLEVIAQRSREKMPQPLLSDFDVENWRRRMAKSQPDAPLELIQSTIKRSVNVCFIPNEPIKTSGLWNELRVPLITC